MRIFGRWPYGTCSQNWEDYQEAHGITQIWERLFIGSVWDAQDLAKTKKNPLGITMVITLCDARVRHNPKVNYLHVPIEDELEITVAQFDSIMDAVAGNIRQGKVLISCIYGTDSAPIIAAGWLHRCGYKNIDAALEEITKLRPTIEPSPILLKRIKELL